jgi:type 2 lantibiotic biosynthesis protein LanM
LPVYDGLYSGRAGIALFLAACDHVNQSSTHRRLIDGALRPVLALLRASDPSHLGAYVRGAGIGAADGVGGLVYALTCISAWRRDRALEDDAERFARAISPEAVAGDCHLDVIGGAAGAILGLMRLYQARPSPEVLRIVRACGERLCAQQMSDGEHAGGWATPAASRPLAGFAHGASGIACALIRLHAVTTEQRLVEAVRAAVEFERAAFLPEARNWIDFRLLEPGTPPSCATGWCHGAPGIALARLALLSDLGHPMVAPDLESALATTRVPGPGAVDHLCCGSFGRIEVLLHAARVLKRSDLSTDAAAQAWDILGRPGPFRVTPGDMPGIRNPGCFDGLAGIGYVLLRLAAPDLLPSVLAFE